MAGLDQATMDLTSRLKELQALGDQRAAIRSQPIYDPIAHLGRADEPRQRQAADRPDRVTVDHPELPEHRVLTYGQPTLFDAQGRIETPPLFYGRPTREQVRQGSLNDGWLLAALGAVAGHRAHALRDVVRERADGCFEVRLHDARWDSGSGDWVPNGRRVELEVTPEVPVDPTDPWVAAFADTRTSRVYWLAALEKAFAGLDQTYTPGHPRRVESGYDRLDEGGTPSDTAQALALLTGQRAGVICLPNHPAYAGDFESVVRDQLCANSPVIVTATSTQEGHGLRGDQAYEITAYAHGLMALRNPTGDDHPADLTARQLIADTTGHLTILR